MAGRRRGQPAVEDAGETRRTILRVAHRLFMAEGYRAVSTRQIADACGLTQPAIYHHFADKQDLYVAVLRESLVELHGGLERIARRDWSVGERLTAVARYLPATRQDMSQMFHDIERELPPEVRRGLEEAFFISVVAPIAAIFDDGVRQGFLRAPAHGGIDPPNAAFLLLTMLRYTAQAQGHAGAIAHTEMIVRVLLYGLAVPGVRDGEDTTTQ